MKCPCGQPLEFAECCQPYIEGTKFPATAEDLMRSRYSAFATGDVEYLKNTLTKDEQRDFDVAATKKWMKDSKWLGLQILSAEKGGANDKQGTVEFIAKYEAEGKVLEHHEVSKFKRDGSGHWFFADGESHTHEEGQGHHHHGNHDPVVREEPKVGRNDPCPCGSGKKYKKCHGA